MCAVFVFFFFFQAEDGIRDIGVTGVQTCALPISAGRTHQSPGDVALLDTLNGDWTVHVPGHPEEVPALLRAAAAHDDPRSEERRVGKECRSRWSPYH